MCRHHCATFGQLYYLMSLWHGNWKNMRHFWHNSEQFLDDARGILWLKDLYLHHPLVQITHSILFLSTTSLLYAHYGITDSKLIVDQCHHSKTGWWCFPKYVNNCSRATAAPYPKKCCQEWWAQCNKTALRTILLNILVIQKLVSEITELQHRHQSQNQNRKHLHDMVMSQLFSVDLTKNLLKWVASCQEKCQMKHHDTTVVTTQWDVARSNC